MIRIPTFVMYGLPYLWCKFTDLLLELFLTLVIGLYCTRSSKCSSAAVGCHVTWNYYPCFLLSLVCTTKHLPVQNMKVWKIYTRINVVDTSIFSGSDPSIHFAKTYTKTIHFWSYHSSLCLTISMDKKQMRQDVTENQ
jgi:hypothetical protein